MAGYKRQILGVHDSKCHGIVIRHLEFQLTSPHPFPHNRKGRDVSYDAPVVKAHQFPQHFECCGVSYVGIKILVSCPSKPEFHEYESSLKTYAVTARLLVYDWPYKILSFGQSLTVGNSHSQIPNAAAFMGIWSEGTYDISATVSKFLYMADMSLNGRVTTTVDSSIHMHESLVIFFILLVLEMKKIDSCIQSQHQR